jgi:hypothetical protein
MNFPIAASTELIPEYDKVRRRARLPAASLAEAQSYCPATGATFIRDSNEENEGGLTGEPETMVTTVRNRIGATVGAAKRLAR